MPIKDRREKLPPYIRIPKNVMDTEDYINLPGNALKLLNELIYQYNGINNGDLSLPMSRLKKRGFNSPTSVKKWIQILIDANLIIKTREPECINPGGKCALYALTWDPIHECQGKHDYKPTRTPIRAFDLERRKPKESKIKRKLQGRAKDSKGRFTKRKPPQLVAIK